MKCNQRLIMKCEAISMETKSRQSTLDRCLRALGGLGVISALLAAHVSHIGYWIAAVFFAISLGFETDTAFPKPNSFRRVYRWFGLLTLREVDHEGPGFCVSLVRNPRDNDGCAMGWADAYILKDRRMWHISGSKDSNCISKIAQRLSAHLNARIIESDEAPRYRFHVLPK